MTLQDSQSCKMARLSESGVARAAERVCWVLACVLIAVYAASRTDAAVNGGTDLTRASEPMAAASVVTASDTFATDLLGSLEIPSIGLRTALYSDITPLNLNRGAGLIPRMAAVGHGGNLGVAAHRDGIFRPLENIRVGAAIEVRTAAVHYVYHVTSITVVERTDTALLRRTDQPSITLVTCYPFRFVGPAPRRFVVRGLLHSTREAAASVTPPLREKTAAI